MNGKHLALALAAAALSLAAGAKPGAKPETVAPGYPAFIMPEAKDWYRGRQLTSSDLRHKIAILLYVRATELQKDLLAVGPLARLNTTLSCGEGASWANLKVPRARQVVVVVVGKTTDAKIMAACQTKNKDDSQILRSFVGDIPIVSGLSYTGGEEVTPEMCPYVAVFGAKGAEPAVKGKIAEVKADAQKKIMGELAKDVPQNWRDYFGSVEGDESKAVPLLAKDLKAGKPLDKATAQAKKGVTNKDEALAQEAQIIFDALEQTKHDLEYKIEKELAAAPYCAAYDLVRLMKYWPSEKKKVAAAVAKTSGGPFADLCKAYVNVKTWTDPNYNCKPSEAKKNVKLIQGYRKKLAPLKDDAKNIALQNAALIVDIALEDAENQMNSIATAK